MSELHRHVEDYLRLRRAIGFKLRLHGDLLPHFADYLEAAGAATITTELAVSFAQLPQGVQPILWAHRLTMAATSSVVRANATASGACGVW